MSAVKWKFRVMGKDELNQDPTQEEFFATEYVGGISDALVRETIQNSLDAKLLKTESKDEIVTVRFYFSGKSNSSDVKLRSHPFFQGIYDHIYANDNGLSKTEFPDFGSKVDYLTIEDFNTLGLDGNVEENDVPKTATPLGHNFFWFWRNVGRTGKTSFELGKWGLGKTVFPSSSLINTFFGLTNRHDDDKNYLMGLSVLKTHHTNTEPEIKRYPYGYFGNFDDQSFEYFATPTEDSKTIANFRTTFNLKRAEQNNSGLSIVIPFPKKELNSAAVVKSVLEQYFYPIIKGRLIVEVVDDDSKLNIRIEQKTISHLLNEIDISPSFQKLFKLCLWSINMTKESLITLNDPPLENAARWQTEWFINDDVQAKIDTQIDVFEENGAVAFDVPVRIKESGEKAKICRFKVFLEKDELLTESDSHFVRDAITITGIRKPKNKGIRAIVVIEDRELVKLLGLAENPAHTEWHKKSPHFVGKYDEGDKVISFIEMAIDKLCTFLMKPPEGIDREIMKDIFFIDTDEEAPDEINEPGMRDGEDSDRPDLQEKEKTNLPFIIAQEIGGFILKRNPECDGFIGRIKVETAYMVAKGGALSKYSEYDFDMSKPPIGVSSSGVSNIEYKRNRIVFDVNSNNDFSIELNGFDEHRDLFIKANHYDSEI